MTRWEEFSRTGVKSDGGRTLRLLTSISGVFRVFLVMGGFS